MYLTCFTGGDCSSAVNQCARFRSNPGPSHIAAARRILRYLAGSRALGLTYTKDAGDPCLASTDAWHHLYQGCGSLGLTYTKDAGDPCLASTASDPAPLIHTHTHTNTHIYIYTYPGVRQPELPQVRCLLRVPCGIGGHSRLRCVERPHICDMRHAPECRVEGLGLAQLGSPRR